MKRIRAISYIISEQVHYHDNFVIPLHEYNYVVYYYIIIIVTVTNTCLISYMLCYMLYVLGIAEENIPNIRRMSVDA